MTIFNCNKKSLVYGIGVNDASYPVYKRVNGKQIQCRFYFKWTKMLTRCYSKKLQEKQPSYIGCTVCKEWLVFSNFKSWMEKQDWQGKQLDKDMLVPGNKIYSPETCCFVSQEINKIIGHKRKNLSRYPCGVCWDSKKRKYLSQITKHGKHCFLGRYLTVNEAEKKYKEAKAFYLKEIAMNQTDTRLKNALLTRSNMLLEVM